MGCIFLTDKEAQFLHADHDDLVMTAHGHMDAQVNLGHRCAPISDVRSLTLLFFKYIENFTTKN